MSSIRIPGTFLTTASQVPFLEMESMGSEVTKGLLSAQAWVSPKYLYDKLGSKLFEAICEAPEYYLTRLEGTILSLHASEISRHLKTDCTLIDLGAGNCEKAEKIFLLAQPKHYVPVDISVDFLNKSVTAMRGRYPHIPITPLALDFSRTLELPSEIVPREKRLFFFPGSSIGNFSKPDALDFLRRIHKSCHEDSALLIGVDLLKDHLILEAAYDDSLGITSAFNLNLLLHLNCLIASDFKPQDWRHKAVFNHEMQRVEMHLQARHHTTVTWKGGRRDFLAGESIHTENSYKYTQAEFFDMLQQSGFAEMTAWTDPDHWFMVCHAKAHTEWN